MSEKHVQKNRKLLKLLDTSQPDNQVTDSSCDLNDLFCNSLFSSIIECDYFDVPSLDFTDIGPTVDHHTTFILLHINMRSINNLKNFDALHEFLTSLSYTPDIICISKTRIKMEPLINISLPNYNFIHTIRLLMLVEWLSMYCLIIST